MSCGAQISDFAGCIESAEFGCLRDGDDAGLYVVLNPLQVSHRLQRLRGEFGVGGGDLQKLGPEGALRCARLVDCNVRPVRADDRVMRTL